MPVAATLLCICLSLAIPSADATAPWTSATPLITNAASDTETDVLPQVATDGRGHWVATWQSLAGSIGKLVYSRSDDNGVTWTPKAYFNTDSATESPRDYFPQIATDRAGNWLAVWTRQGFSGNPLGADIDILCAASTDNGASWSSPVCVNTDAFVDAQDDTEPCLATDGRGHWIVTWYSDRVAGGSFGTDQDVFYALSSDAGATWSAPAPLNTNAASDHGDDRKPYIGIDPSGAWIAVWSTRDRPDGTVAPSAGIAFSRSVDQGYTWSTPQRINSASDPDARWESESEPEAVSDGLGR